MSLNATKDPEFGKCPPLVAGGVPGWWDLMSHLKAWSFPMYICKFAHGWQSSYEQPNSSLSILHISPEGALGAELQTCLVLTQPSAPGAPSLHRPSQRSSETPLLNTTAGKDTGKNWFLKFSNTIQAGFNHWIILWHDSSLFKPENWVLRVQQGQAAHDKPRVTWVSLPPPLIPNNEEQRFTGDLMPALCIFTLLHNDQ